jgi:hypothetical protein
MKNTVFAILLVSITLLAGCVKEEGVGGTCTITGKVYAYDYNAEMTHLRAQYYAPDEDVYIIYGSDSVFADRTRTSFEGSYRFEYLRPGTYTIFAYSKNIVTGLPPDLAVKKTVQILSDGQSVIVEDIMINK